MAKRIVSLLPAATEYVYDLGLSVVGRSHACDTPPQVKKLPAVTHDYIKAATVTRASVNDLLAQSLSPYTVELDKLKSLRPDFVIGSPSDAVAEGDEDALSLTEISNGLRALVETHPTLLVLKAESLEELYRELNYIGQALGKTELAASIVEDMRRRMEAIHKKALEAHYAPKVLCLTGLAPLVSAGWWVPALVEYANGRQVLTQADEAPHRITWEQIIEADPDKIVFMLAGKTLTEAGALVRDQVSNGDFRTLRAWKSKEIYLADGDAYFNRPGPHLTDAVEILAQMLHPHHFSVLGTKQRWTEFF